MKSFIFALKSLKKFIQSKYIFLNGLIVSSNPSILILSRYFNLARKKVYIYWHTTEWHWKGLFPRNKGLVGILINKLFFNLIKNSLNIAVSNYGKIWIERKFDLKKEVKILYNTIDYGRIIKLSKKPLLTHFEDNYKIITSIAAPTLRKGFDIFLITAGEAPNNFIFIWIGKIGKLSDTYKKKILEINSSAGYEKIKVYNFLDNPYTILKRSDIFFLPSRDEPFGLVYLEAFALGKFAISPLTTGFSELITNNEHAYIYKDVKEVIDLLKSEKLQYYTSHFDKERKELAQKFDNKQFNKNLLKILKFNYQR